MSESKLFKLKEGLMSSKQLDSIKYIRNLFKFEIGHNKMKDEILDNIRSLFGTDEEL